MGPPTGGGAPSIGGSIGSLPLTTGTVLQVGRYAVDQALGKGGMGSVYLARDTHVNDKRVVIKEMANIYATEEERREAERDFQAEMATLASLSHPNIPQISDFFTESNRHFAVQEYVSGQDLQKTLEGVQAPNQRPQGLPEKQVLGWTSQILGVLDYLEGQNPQVIHRDIKPANIIVDANNRVRVVDFGIASHKYRPGTQQAAAQLSTALGTPGYAPREQFGGQETTLSDLYALGATMHHLLTGRDPTKATPLFAYPPMRTLNSRVSEASERIVATAVQDDPAKRYQSAAEMKKAVDRVLNPPGMLSTGRGRAIAVGVILALLLLAGGGSYLYSQQQGKERPTGSLSTRGEVAFDTDMAGLSNFGVTGGNQQAWIDAKVQASKDMKNGNTQSALNNYNNATTLNQADAESAIYVEDNAILVSGQAYYKIAIGGSFSKAASGADDVGVGRQDLQGAYAAQHAINNAGGIHGHKLYLVLADDASSTTGAQGAAQAVATQSDVLAFVGFAYSSRTKAALPYIAGGGIAQIAPTASSPTLNGSRYFFRTCPSDTQQALYGVDYLLNTLLAGNAKPKIAVFGDPTDTYANGLQHLVIADLAARNVAASSTTYTIGGAASRFDNLAGALKTQGVQAVYFAGYAREALLLSAAMDRAGIAPAVPIMTDDAFYDPSQFQQNPTGKGRFHFTSYFFPDQYNLPGLSVSQGKAIKAMEAAYKQDFLSPSVSAGGYGTSRVSADTALYYDAVETVATAINYLKPNGVTRISVQAALQGVGVSSSYSGISGQIRYVTPVQDLTGDPINKAMVVLHLDAARGRTHLDKILGQY